MGVALTVLGAGFGGDTPPVAPSRPAGRLIDSHGRTIRDLRLSITDRCNFRCRYCLEPGVEFLPSENLLSVDELVRVARVCTTLGIDKIRITGGEPTVHPQLTEIIARLAELPFRDLSMTTNGARSTREAIATWKKAGLRRLTVSIDSVDPARFQDVTRSKTPVETVLAGIRYALEAGLDPVRLNAVVIRGVNEREVADLAALARTMGVEMRFIEFMPLDSGRDWGMDKVVPAEEIIERIQERYPLVELGRPSPSSTSLDYSFADGALGRVGVIAPVTRPFCGACSRLRVTADGKVRPCLFSRDEWDLVPMLRAGVAGRAGPPVDDAALALFLQDAVWTKQAGHGIAAEGFRQPERTMSAIGG